VQQQQQAAAAATHRSEVSDLAFDAASLNGIYVRCSPEEITGQRTLRSGAAAAAAAAAPFTPRLRRDAW